MKLKLFTLLLLAAIGFVSCRKTGTEPDIKQYDQQQIQSYIAANGITGMQNDAALGDTTGIYYKIINQGTGPVVDYPDAISFVYTLRSFDGKFVAADTVLNHYYGYLGHVSPNGLMLGIHNFLKNKGGKMRIVIPSHLAYGVSGVGSGSKTITTGRIAGNQCLDYTVELINNQSVYDDLVINSYLAANSLTGYTKTADGLYYKITTPGTGTDPITYNSTISCTYTGTLLNGTIFDSNTVAPGATFNIPDLTAGAMEGIQHATVGTTISMLIPSALAYGTAGASGSAATVPANACLRFEFTVLTVSP
jgi:FKBP-type peptidyl-prolyl cis-trans isomerase FkpA